MKNINRAVGKLTGRCKIPTGIKIWVERSMWLKIPSQPGRNNSINTIHVFYLYHVPNVTFTKNPGRDKIWVEIYRCG
jgi:hypothetical protein